MIEIALIILAIYQRVNSLKVTFDIVLMSYLNEGGGKLMKACTDGIKIT